jgi:hypothetical protein
MGRSGYEEKKIEYETLQSRVPRRALVVNSGRL